MTKIFKFLFSLVLLLVLAGGIYVFVLFSNAGVENYIFKDFKPNLTTQIFDRNGKLIANIFDKEHRFYANYDELPPRLIEALVAIEDTAFFEHDGVNIDAIARAVIKMIQAGRAVEGASTLTQQLIKNTELTPEKTITRKIKEALLAYKLENELSKEQIIERYLNHIFFGHGYYGVKTAARGYFRKELDSLSLKEIAILVGLPKAPSSYDPTRNLNLSLSRANAVVQRMFNLGWISEAEYKQALAEVPTIYDDTLTQNAAPYVVDEVIKRLSPTLPDLKSAGYNIELNIDLNVQELAQNALKFGYDEIVKRDKDANLSVLNGAMVVMDHQNGDVLALVGGVDYNKSNFNRATQSLRQPGSTFKPFVYQIAIDLGYNPMSEVADISRVFEGADGEKDWKPSNLGGSLQGLVTLKDALTRSRNLATINLALDIGLDVLYQRMLAFGFSDKIPADLSIVLGSFGISPLDFAKFYSMFGNYGVIEEPLIIKNVKNANDEIILSFESNATKVAEPEQVFLTLDMMKNVVNRGTGSNARVAGIEVAGKTGTSNESIDTWFVGITPEIEALIWYGNDNNKPLKRIEGGARTAAPVFKAFLSEYIKLYPQTKRVFSVPDKVKKGMYNGQSEYYTPKSPFPQKSIHSLGEDEMLF
ncbi:penicillin-binding protein [Campylobacter sp. MIT 12-8780]|uniref:PBP1A family penicillin-binding protein n=1 Tax=unclassified Campylobacter TaxID=2593542 RepID=UPI00115E17AB|nr:MULTISPECIES: PBP1A family penicillin-binding protein [unclassified Campylobacter]NDJ26458.1 PBP1A family penicillin-binding protein [Campylobacter sp. MIT 19-121]TQR43030.1 penicillin-binding protein [Campylobacter sp. MIT 12-8780]